MLLPIFLFTLSFYLRLAYQLHLSIFVFLLLVEGFQHVSYFSLSKKNESSIAKGVFFPPKHAIIMEED
jgi:hypothetical protein